LKFGGCFGDKELVFGTGKEEGKKFRGQRAEMIFMDFFRGDGSSDSVGHSAYLTGKVPGG
jgi:hypothetical protein